MISSSTYSLCPQKNAILRFGGVKLSELWLNLYKKVQTLVI
jgi:hypothetical protein